jgi:subtilisin family serine protease
MQNTKNWVAVSAACAALFMTSLGARTHIAVAQTDPVKVLSGRYIITRKSTSTASAAASTRNYVTKRSTGYFDVVEPTSSQLRVQSVAPRTEELNWSKVSDDCRQIEQDPSVASCEPDVLVPLAAVPNDADFGKLWAFDAPVEDTDVDAPRAWDRGTGSAKVLVGVIDTGIYYEHPDLSPNIWKNPAEPVDGIDNDGNGYIDDVRGINGYFGNNDPIDCNGHGTHVAGIIGAKGNNGIGVTGVNWTSSIITASARFDCGKFLSSAGVIAAYNYFYDLKVRGHDIRVVNASYSAPVSLQAEYDAISRLQKVGVLLVASAGNEKNNNSANPSYPASYDLPNIISVAATNRRLALASYSNYGANVHIAAPGGELGDAQVGILSTYSPLAEGEKWYASLSGTSMAAPIVAGAVALVASQAPQLSGAQLKEIMLASAYTIPGLEGVVAGGRFLNLAGMAELAADPTDQCPSDPNKTGPGACGCGVADTDSDGDGTPNCKDSCPSDRGKTSPGVCGCGFADSDANGNGKIDCLDTGLGSIVPEKPELRVRGRALFISMVPSTGVNYYLQITVIPPWEARSRRKTRFYVVNSPVVRMQKPGRRWGVRVRYAYLAAGSDNDFSYWSNFTSKTMR